MINTRHQAEQALRDGRELAAGGYSIGCRIGFAVERVVDGNLELVEYGPASRSYGFASGEKRTVVAGKIRTASGDYFDSIDHAIQIMWREMGFDSFWLEQVEPALIARSLGGDLSERNPDNLSKIRKALDGLLRNDV